MSKKQKPPYIWDEGSPDGYQWPTLFDWDYVALSKTLNSSSLSEDIRVQLQDAVRTFFEWKDHTKYKPRRSDVLSSLKKIEKLSRELIDTFDAIDSRTLKALFETTPFKPSQPFFKKDSINDYGLFDDDADFRKIHAASKEALSILKPDKGGPTDKNTPYNYLIPALATIYYEVTGYRATIAWNGQDDCYTGPFFQFVRAFLKIIKEKTWSEGALGSQIKRILKKNIPAK